MLNKNGKSRYLGFKLDMEKKGLHILPLNTICYNFEDTFYHFEKVSQVFTF